MSKSNELADKVLAGAYRIDGLAVYRKTATGEWVRATGWRKDVVARAAVVVTRRV